jgi:hypothetical protein
MMNWKLLFQLSLLGLIMAFATVWLIPEKFEIIFWVVIWAFCAYMIAKVCTRRYFLHGFVLSLFNSVWITLVHAIFCVAYLNNHADMSPDKMHMPAALVNHPREIMVIFGPIFGAFFGLIQGLFAFIASKMVKKPAVQA